MIGIITDSTCDIPEELLTQYGIIVVPHMVIWGEDQYRDRVDLKTVDFYRRYETDPVPPHSSMPTVQDFWDAFERAIQQGADSLIVLTVSSAMSGTYQVVKTAVKELRIPVAVVDSKGPTMTLGWQVLAAARARETGADLMQIVNYLDQLRARLVQFVAMDSLKYLQIGGRIGNAAKWAGTLLQVKPLVSINHQTGLVEPVAIPRTHRSLVDMLYKKFFEQIGSCENLHVAVLHGNVFDEAKQLAERIEAEYHPIEMIINMTGPVLGINTGPGALALCGYAEG
jgi:DegV family protein with EDD domain